MTPQAFPRSESTIPPESTFADLDTSGSDASDGLAGLSHCRSEGRNLKLIPSSSSPASYSLPPRLHHSDPSDLDPLPVLTLNSIRVAAVSEA
eukprot:446316-Rhodomonas_salina.1